MTVVMTALIDATPQTAWHRWLTGNKVGLLNQVVAHAVCCIPVARNAKVPNSGVTWQDLEQDGIVFMLSPGNLWCDVYIPFYRSANLLLPM